MQSQDNSQGAAIEKMVPVLCFDCKETIADEGGEEFCSALCLKCGNKRVESKKDELTKTSTAPHRARRR